MTTISIITPLTLNYFNPEIARNMYIFGFISILPMLIYVIFFEKNNKPESYFGVIGYKLIKFLRLLKGG